MMEDMMKFEELCVETRCRKYHWGSHSFTLVQCDHNTRHDHCFAFLNSQTVLIPDAKYGLDRSYPILRMKIYEFIDVPFTYSSKHGAFHPFFLLKQIGLPPRHSDYFLSFFEHKIWQWISNVYYMSFLNYYTKGT